ncbi:hypothetical protein J2744_003090 [Halorubrum trapanicum]|uniref:Uncharacterized protein n=1 Tax=Halorubrum trapanicum TaxID=29284 RepID=A0A8J7RYF5_9EURY|nr:MULTISPECIES: hypothetical protein [Halorubrum]MBP1903385.1 hypothetical protein [Halorubrum trapanicum]
MFDRLRAYIPQISLTALQVTLIEKLVFWESNTEVQTDDLQDTIERQSQPVVKSRGKEIQSKSGRGTTFDILTIQLENLGEGVAQNLYIRPTLVVSYHPDPGERTPIDIEDACFLTPDGDGFEILPRFFALNRTEGDDFENDSRDGGVLSPNEGRVEFSTQVEFEEVFHGEEGRAEYIRSPVFETTQRLSHAGIRYISFQLHVLYTDVNGNVHAEQVMGKTGGITSGVTLEDICEFRFSSESSDHKLHRRVEETFKYPP